MKELNNKISSFLWLTSKVLLIGFLILYLGALGLFFFQIPLGFSHSLLFLLPAAVIFLAKYQRKGGLYFIYFVSFVITISLIFGQFQDFSWDGMAVRQGYVENLVQGGFPKEISMPHLVSGWLAFVSKNIPSGKAVNLLGCIAAFGSCLRFLRETKIPAVWVWLTSLTASLNPVAIYQLNSFYIDGFTASILTSLVCAFLLVYVSPNSLGRWFFLGINFFLASASKPSGLFYGVILGTFFLLALLFKKNINLRFWRAALAGSVVLFVGVVGFKLQRGPIPVLAHLIYLTDLKTPGLGIGPGSFAPAEAAAMNKLEAFLRSHFAPTRTMSDEWAFKNPLWFERPELALFEDLNPDPRSGGFGPLYGGAFIFSFLAILSGLFQKPGVPIQALIPAFALLSSCLLSQAWWARWVPQGWLVPLALALPGFILSSRKWSYRFSSLAVFLAMLNSILILVFYISGCFQNQRILNQQLAYLKSVPSPVKIYVPTFPSNLTWLRSKKILHSQLSDEPDRPRLILQRTNSKVKLPPDWRMYFQSTAILKEWEKRKLLED